MKKIVLLVAFAFLGTTVSFAQDIAVAKTEIKKTQKTKKVKAAKIVEAKKASLPQIEGAGLVFETETIDYGTIAHNADGRREFVFTNNGNKPLIITNTQGTCGCTVPTSPKEPIAPGAKGIIGVKYATDRVGAFSKNVIVTSNAEGQPTKTLTIKGTVLADPTPAAPKS
jgi:hypothetical protein